MNTPKDWWKSPLNAKEWIEQNNKRTKAGEHNSTVESTKIVLGEIGKFIKNNKPCAILEIGSGDGRLIGSLSNKYNEESINCYATDINKSLLKHIDKNFKNVGTFESDIIRIDAPDDTFDLVFTYQVLQHIPPEDINKAISELVRVSKNEVWMWEGIGRTNYEHGAKTHNAHNGSWVWHIDKMMNCYEVGVPSNEYISLDRQRLYKFKK